MKVKEESEKADLKLSIQKTKIMASGPITSWQIEGETMETVTDFIFLGSKITVDSNCSYEIKRRLLLERKAMTNLRQHIKKQRNYFVDKGPSSQSYDFSSVRMWELDNKKGWTLKNWYFWTVVLEKTRVPWTARRSINLEVNAKYSLEGLRLIGKDSDAGKDWRQEEKGMTEDEMVGCHHRLNGHEFEQTPGNG